MSREPVDPATSATRRGPAAEGAARLAPQPRSLEQIVGDDQDADAADPPHARDHRSTAELLTILLEEERSHGN
jgi:hypothetical protein